MAGRSKYLLQLARICFGFALRCLVGERHEWGSARSATGPYHNTKLAEMNERIERDNAMAAETEAITVEN